MDRMPVLRLRREAFDHGTMLPGTIRFTVDALQRLALAAQVHTRSSGGQDGNGGLLRYA